MKTASIVTMHFPCNYGAVLQTYGLFHYLQKQGLDVNIINYVPEYFKDKISLWYVGNPKYKNNPFIRLLYYIWMVPLRIEKNRVYAKFRKEELNETKLFSQNQLMNGEMSSSDYYFCGSDQIWNEKNDTISDPVYFLQFVKGKGKRYSYAASGTISSPFSETVQRTVIPWLKSFDKIAVREDTIQQSLQEALKLEVKHVCDPVFLLGQDEWISLATKGRVNPTGKPYIIVYAIGDDTTPYFKGRKLGDRLKMPVYAISWSKVPYVDKIYRCTPYEFISLIAGASYVINNSFHGTAFPIIFNREFRVCDTTIANHRLLSILRTTGLEFCLVHTNDEVKTERKIEWNNVNLKMKNYISKSRNYIKSCI